MLPEIGVVEKRFIMRVLTLKQPLTEFIQVRDTDLAFTLEVPREGSVGPAPKGLQGNFVWETVPWVISLRPASDWTKDRRQYRAQNSLENAWD